MSVEQSEAIATLFYVTNHTPSELAAAITFLHSIRLLPENPETVLRLIADHAFPISSFPCWIKNDPSRTRVFIGIDDAPHDHVDVWISGTDTRATVDELRTLANLIDEAAKATTLDS